MPKTPGEATLLELKKYFEYGTLKDFQADWGQLTPTDQAQLRQGVGNGSMTY